MLWAEDPTLSLVNRPRSDGPKTLEAQLCFLLIPQPSFPCRNQRHMEAPSASKPPPRKVVLGPRSAPCPAHWARELRPSWERTALLLSLLPGTFGPGEPTEMETRRPKNHKPFWEMQGQHPFTVRYSLTNTVWSACSAPDKVSQKSSPSEGKQSRGFRITRRTFVTAITCYHKSIFDALLIKHLWSTFKTEDTAWKPHSIVEKNVFKGAGRNSTVHNKITCVLQPPLLSIKLSETKDARKYREYHFVSPAVWVCVRVCTCECVYMCDRVCTWVRGVCRPLQVSRCLVLVVHRCQNSAF